MTAPTLAEVEALALRARAGDPSALEEYPDAAKALLDHNLSRGDFRHQRGSDARGGVHRALGEDRRSERTDPERGGGGMLTDAKAPTIDEMTAWAGGPERVVRFWKLLEEAHQRGAWKRRHRERFAAARKPEGQPC